MIKLFEERRLEGCFHSITIDEFLGAETGEGSAEHIIPHESDPSRIGKIGKFCDNIIRATQDSVPRQRKGARDCEHPKRHPDRGTEEASKHIVVRLQLFCRLYIFATFCAH